MIKTILFDLDGTLLNTIDDLAERLMMSRRTVYRYIDTFREAGFVIKKSGEHIRLDKESPHFKDISQLIHFTEEEAVILKSAIENIDDDNLLKQNLKRKLYSVYDNRTLADTIVKGRLSGIVHNLVGAIAEKRQVVLQAYRSARGAAVRDRRVEPFAFTTNYVNIWCYDTEDGLCKLFKTSRIGAVLPLGDEWVHEAEHREGFMDIFRMNGHDRHRIRLRLGMLAHNLLVEEYPLAERDLAPDGESHWLLETEVAGFAGVARFVAGLLDDVEIVDSPELNPSPNSPSRQHQNGQFRKMIPIFFFLCQNLTRRFRSFAVSKNRKLRKSWEQPTKSSANTAERSSSTVHRPATASIRSASDAVRRSSKPTFRSAALRACTCSTAPSRSSTNRWKSS